MQNVYRLLGPAQPTIPLVFDSPHSGNRFPADFGAAVDEAELREGEDCYIDELYACAEAHGAPLLAAEFPRTYLDVNRHAGDVDLELLDGPWPWEHRPSGKERIGKSLIWRYLGADRPIYARRLGVQEVKARIDRYHAPYHAALRGLLDAAHAAHGVVYHINCHSMPAVAGKLSDDTEGTERADMVLGDRDGTTCEPAFTARVREALERMGYAVKVNDPFKGVELVRAYSDPAGGRHSLQIEIKRTLYMDEMTREKIAGFDKLRSDLASLVASLADYAGQASKGNRGQQLQD